jgi:four helix bundle protein
MKKEMENRLVNFVAEIYEISKELDSSFIASHLSNQMVRSSTSAALNFAEANAAESRKDFIHKASIVLKELRETNVNLRVILQTSLCKDNRRILLAMEEVDELMAIFYKSIQTAKKNGTEIRKNR